MKVNYKFPHNKANQLGRNTRWRSYCAGYLQRYAQNKVRYEFDIEIMKSVKLL